jgi:flagellar assembly protein FliH
MVTHAATANAEPAPMPIWSPPTVDGPRVGKHRDEQQARTATATDIDAAYARGHAEGLAAGQQALRQRMQEAQQCVTSLHAVLNNLQGALRQVDEAVSQQLTELAVMIARHLLRRELRADPTQVIAIVRETVALLPITQANIKVHLHPGDAEIVRTYLAEPQVECSWRIVEDPMQSRGGCRVSTDSSLIDARIEARINAIAGHLLGDERSEPRQEEPP